MNPHPSNKGNGNGTNNNNDNNNERKRTRSSRHAKAWLPCPINPCPFVSVSRYGMLPHLISNRHNLTICDFNSIKTGSLLPGWWATALKAARPKGLDKAGLAVVRQIAAQRFQVDPYGLGVDQQGVPIQHKVFAPQTPADIAREQRVQSEALRLPGLSNPDLNPQAVMDYRDYFSRACIGLHQDAEWCQRLFPGHSGPMGKPMAGAEYEHCWLLLG